MGVYGPDAPPTPSGEAGEAEHGAGTGATGAPGASGDTGSDGANGTDGADGGNGPDGLPGPTGHTGELGPDGRAGSDGADGSAGARGENGSPGATGIGGTPGADGSDAIEGDTGPKGATGIKGARGPQGAPGDDGADGETGDRGPPGPTGVSRLFSDFVLDVPAVLDGALGYVDVSTVGAWIEPLAINDDIRVRALSDSPPFTCRVVGTDTVRLQFAGAVSAIVQAPFRIDKVVHRQTPQDLVSSWLRTALATVDGSNLISSLPDVLNLAHPAVASGSARPLRELSANGLPLAKCGSLTALSLPVANVNGTSQWGIALWMRSTGESWQRPIHVPFDGAKVYIQAPNTNTLYNVFFGTVAGQTPQVQMTVPGTLAIWNFFTFEFNLNNANRVTASCNGKLTIGGGSGASPLLTSTGVMQLGRVTGSAERYSPGWFPPNIFFRMTAMPGATQGVWTPAARAALMAYEAPT